MRVSQFAILSIAALVAFSGCKGAKNGHSDRSGEGDAAVATKHTSAEPTHNAMTDAGAQAAPGAGQLPDPLRGTVKESMDAGAYTYLLLNTAHGEVWAAARRFTVAVGDEVEIAGLQTMVDFRSPTLDRTFDKIEFVGMAHVVGDEDAAGHAASPEAAMGLPPGHPPLTGGESAPANPEAVKVEKLVDGVTVADLFAKKAELEGSSVKFSGKVVKANSGILGVNWMHIQDGTGASGTNDITVTSKEDFAAVGTEVVVEGTLVLNKDFGAGYAYDVIIENAKVVAAAP